ncbi:hypothetical protein DY023_02000 [Microbacterium bovistercoris]|uniref:PqqD family protein n=1 Tax=Microbacterium bovistercoris TaxID=2293570 RepID=A0A371NXQ1_9MICO|nr:hypothetical protein [Microbacterium bovistercoris]REJ08061.1 hypothetical protein DY023_02000 [Microbacterium bovistercoris]
MSSRYAIAPEVAWVDGTDGGRAQSIAYIARLDTAQLFELKDAAWLIWVLLDEGIDTADALRTEVDTLDAVVDFGPDGIEGFLSALEQTGLLVAA